VIKISTTAQQIYKKSLALIDELSATGGIDANKTKDYAGKAPSLIDMIQKELASAGNLYKIYRIAYSPIPNMLGDQYRIDDYKGIELTYEGNINQFGSVKAYYFEVDKPCTVYIEDYTNTWNVLATVAASPTVAGFTAYKGIVTPTNGATKARIRATGTYYFRIVNRALFNYPLQVAPEYAPWVEMELPADLKSIKQVVAEYPIKEYVKTANYKVEHEGNRQSLYVEYDFNGELKIEYNYIPTEITALTDTLELDDINVNIIAYELAKNFMAAEQNEFMTNVLTSKYNQLKAESFIKQPSTIDEIQDVYGGWW
jgi:hypothetical protein